MTTMHEASAAYVKAQQRPEQLPKPDPHATYEPACLQRWAWQVQAMDDTTGIQDKEQVK